MSLRGPVHSFAFDNLNPHLVAYSKRPIPPAHMLALRCDQSANLQT